MNSSARLVVQIGAQPERTYPIERDITIIGREAINDLVVNDAEVSRRHTRLVRQADGYLIEDLGSTNGTFVNGKRVTVPTLLYHGDVVDMGKSVHLIFQLDQPYEQVTKPIQLEQDPPLAQSAAAAAIPPEHEPYAPSYEESAERVDAPVPEPTFEELQSSEPIYEEAFEEYEEADSAEFYRPPADPVVVESDKVADIEDESGGCQRYVMTCGCLTLLFIFLFVAALFILDNVAPEFLYCGPLRGVWEAILSPVLNATGRVWVCP